MAEENFQGVWGSIWLKKFDLAVGSLSTGNSLDHTLYEEKFFAKYDIRLKDMEAASLAWLCRELGVKFISIKAITDIVSNRDGVATNSSSAKQFERNFNEACLSLASFLQTLFYENKEALNAL